ncbi:MAG: SBBP repeat-containing protein [Blastocatellia bacterium]|nr:SBBP repeat-containing protein [Blastocatellia bacterium]
MLFRNRLTRSISLASFALVLAAMAAMAFRRSPSVEASFDGGREASGGRQAEMKRAYGRLPMNFEANQGQAAAEVRYLARGHGYQVFLMEREAALALHEREAAPAADPADRIVDREEQRQRVLRFKVESASPEARMAGKEELRTKSNYLIGNDPAAWRTGIPNFARVEAAEVYPGIGLAWYGTQQALEYDFVLGPGADPEAITMSIEGADRIEVDSNGDLVLRVGSETVYQRAPVSYQTIDGARRTVTSRYQLKGENRIGFAVEGYDAKRQLVIDPVIDFSTFFGGIGSDEGFAIAIDGTGAAYVTGTTYSNNFNTFAPLQTINRGGKFDAFVTKINAAGTGIVYSTYLGGSAEDAGRGIAVDASGNACIAGITNSPDFNTRNPLQPTITGLTEDAFVTKVNADGTNLIFSTYFGGSSIDQAFGIALDAAGDIYLAGSTISGDFRTQNPFQPGNQGNSDAFVAKIKGDGSQTIYSSYLGGTGFDEAYSVAVDAFGNAYVAGQTASTNFNTANALQPGNAGGGSDAFLTKVNAQGTALIYSTYVGGSAVDVAYGVTVDVNTNAYLTGHTFSTDYPLANPLQGSNAGSADAFISRVNAFGSAFVYSTYLGGAGGDFSRGIAVDGNAQAYIAGRTASTDFPLSNALQPTNRGNLDAFVAKLSLTGSQLVYSTYLGGSDDDLAYGITVDSGGNAFVVGDARSTDFNTKSPLQAANRGGLDAFVSKFTPGGTTLSYSTYLGSGGEDLAFSVALDTAGNAYITGYTSSNDFTTRSPIQPTNKGGLDAFVTKILADASDIAFNTYFGGNGSDTGYGIAVDSSGNCYVTGATTSTNLPTRNPIQATNRGGLDVFIAKFNALGSNIVYSTYLGGGFGDLGRGIAVDLSGNAFIAGSTFSDDFPVQGAFQGTNRGLGDAFVARINPAGTALTYCSFLGGAGTDEAAGIAIDGSGSAYVVGNTGSGDFNTRNPLQPTNRGQQDIFLSKVAGNGAQLIYSTYLGGNRADIGNSVAVDGAGSAFITGSTASPNFPLQSALQTSYGGGDLDAFAVKVNSAGSALVFSTYLGGGLAEVGNAISVDSFGNSYVAGVTSSLNFPVRNAIQADNRGGNDAFITKFNQAGTALIYSTYLGGSNDDRGSGIAVDSTGTAYATGATASPNFNIQFPLLAYGGGSDVFVAKILSEPSLSLSPSTLELQTGTAGMMSVTLSAPLAQAVTVALSSSNPAVASVPASVTIPGGSVTVDFTVTGGAQGAPATITATLPQSQGGATATATVLVAQTNRILQAPSQAVAAGGLLTLPIELVSQGNENRLAFSLQLDTSLLLNPQFTLGADATSATLTTNLSLAAQGRFGILIQLPPGQTFAAGTRQALVLSVVVISGANATSTTVAFGDSPTVRRIADLSGNSLSTNYAPATITIASGYEGDVAPRPNGNNGSVTIADWVQTGRFAAGFDTAAIGSEFQRADTAPRASFGNGAITISDWVQTGRYAAGLDPIAAAAGPAGPAASVMRTGDCAACAPFSITDVPAAFGLQQTRAVRVAGASVQRGQQVVVNLELDSLGNENAIGFSLNYAAAQLSFVSAAAGADGGGATLNVNSAQTAQGRIGLAMALPAGQSFAAGTRRIVAVTFLAPAGGTANAIPIAIGDQPIAREIVNANAETLTTTWTNGTVTIARAVANVSAASFLGAELASEQIIAAFGTGLATTTQVATAVPLPTNIAGTTVSVRDSQGTSRLAPLFFVAPTQINYQIPPDTATGAATVTVTSGDGSISVGTINISAVAPSLFSASATGQGIAAATALRVKADGTQIFEPIGQFDAQQNRFVPIPIDLGPASDQVFLIAYGTGLRGRSSLASVNVKMGGTDCEVLFLGSQGGFVGLDQANIRIPRSLLGRGEIDVVTTVDGKPANTVRVSIK